MKTRFDCVLCCVFLQADEYAGGFSANDVMVSSFGAGNGFNTRVQQIWCKIGSISVLGQLLSSTRYDYVADQAVRNESA